MTGGGDAPRTCPREAELLTGAVDSTVSGNTVDDTDAMGPGAGAGMFIDGGVAVDGPVEIVRSTISGNALTGSGTGQGGGIFNEGETTLASVTLAANGASSGANLFGDSEGEITARNSLITDPAGGSNCDGTNPPVSAGHNLEDGSSCELTGPGDLATTFAPASGTRSAA